ncbi:hypothetical protein [Paenibacillus oryzisoli]|uniref:DUF4355 domain-containing protein n=1 Tax=Paenibacillus oryzisoli TaxID=1850517 RepID=A0A198ADT3_9BACL|nr:hypothetical protein [Paenibacillus oryzisoli]OAS19250.1 hypothetical protein A8708_26425 [Paenibacillus oryzisoli]
MFKVRQPLFEMEGAIGSESGVESVPAAEVQTTGVDSQAAAEPKDSNFEKAFAKRLSAKEAEWQAKYQELEGKYKGHEDYKYVADYLQQAHGADLMTIKEKIEMERLQERSERENVPPEVLKRLDELESKAAKADQLEKEQLQRQQEQQEAEEKSKTFAEFKGKLDEFAKERGVDSDSLYKFMVDNQTANMEIALKAMKHDEIEQKLAAAEKAGMKKLISAKAGIPTVTSANKTGTLATPPAKNLAEARQRAMNRLNSTE